MATSPSSLNSNRSGSPSLPSSERGTPSGFGDEKVNNFFENTRSLSSSPTFDAGVRESGGSSRNWYVEFQLKRQESSGGRSPEAGSSSSGESSPRIPFNDTKLLRVLRNPLQTGDSDQEEEEGCLNFRFNKAGSSGSGEDSAVLEDQRGDRSESPGDCVSS